MPEAFGNDVCFADGTARVTERLLVVAQQQVDAGSPGLLALQQGTDSSARSGEHVPGPIRDLGGRQPARRPIDEEQPDLFATHTSIIPHTASEPCTRLN